MYFSSVSMYEVIYIIFHMHWYSLRTVNRKHTVLYQCLTLSRTGYQVVYKNYIYEQNILEKKQLFISSSNGSKSSFASQTCKVLPLHAGLQMYKTLSIPHLESGFTFSSPPFLTATDNDYFFPFDDPGRSNSPQES